eukprot:scaffold111945_cov31-Tisochrysis_lutea.AAC.4
MNGSARCGVLSARTNFRGHGGQYAAHRPKSVMGRQMKQCGRDAQCATMRAQRPTLAISLGGAPSLHAFNMVWLPSAL